jgi:hypothetical protein
MWLLLQVMSKLPQKWNRSTSFKKFESKNKKQDKTEAQVTNKTEHIWMYTPIKIEKMITTKITKAGTSDQTYLR